MNRPDEAPGPYLPVDLAANAQSLGAHVLRAHTVEELRARLEEAKAIDSTIVVYVEVDRYAGVPIYESWWDVPVAEVSDVPEAQTARAKYEQQRRAQRHPRCPRGSRQFRRAGVGRTSSMWRSSATPPHRYTRPRSRTDPGATPRLRVRQLNPPHGAETTVDPKVARVR